VPGGKRRPNALNSERHRTAEWVLIVSWLPMGVAIWERGEAARRGDLPKPENGKLSSQSHHDFSLQCHPRAPANWYLLFLRVLPEKPSPWEIVVSINAWLETDQILRQTVPTGGLAKNLFDHPNSWLV
jgi:hypothetical protein